MAMNFLQHHHRDSLLFDLLFLLAVHSFVMKKKRNKNYNGDFTATVFTRSAED
jgi:hypothetical protein